MNTLSTSFSKNLITDDLNINIKITKNTFHLPLEDFFSIGARINPKRSFLFVNHLLGKHVPTHPVDMRFLGVLLKVSLFQEKGWTLPLPEADFLAAKGISEKRNILRRLEDHPFEFPIRALVIGFAETATGLGHAFFDHTKNSMFIHTTREEVETAENVFSFEEEHSHATSHRCLVHGDNPFEEADLVLLVDDEMTTGKTNLNLIDALDKQYPNKTYVALALLDWRSKSHHDAYEVFESERDLDVSTCSLVCGDFSYDAQKHYADAIEHLPTFDCISDENASTKSSDYLKETGRFLLRDEESHLPHELAARYAQVLLRYNIGADNPTQIIGFGEFMHIPNLVADHMSHFLEKVSVHSMSRSPVLAFDTEGYPIRNKFRFEESGVAYHLYNILPETKCVRFLTEQPLSLSAIKQLTQYLRSLDIYDVQFCSFNTFEHRAPLHTSKTYTEGVSIHD